MQILKKTIVYVFSNHQTTVPELELNRHFYFVHKDYVANVSNITFQGPEGVFAGVDGRRCSQCLNNSDRNSLYSISPYLTSESRRWMRYDEISDLQVCLFLEWFPIINQRFYSWASFVARRL